MFLGILIGLTVFGLILYFSNFGGDQVSAFARTLGLASFLIGICGAIGWIIEVCVS